MKITLVGMGMGGLGSLTMEAHSALRRANTIIGSQRLLDALPSGIAADQVALTSPAAIDEWIAAHLQAGQVCVVYSGDVGFYSGAAALRALLAARGIEHESLCGISSGQYLCAKLGIPWQDVRMCSAHGRDCNILAEILSHEQCIFLLGGDTTVSTLCQMLCNFGLGDCIVTAAERLSSPEERIITGTAQELAGQIFDSLCVVLVRRTRRSFRWESQACGIPDDVFLRGGIPMTKREVRCVVLSHLALRQSDVVWDIGAGTGSVAVEAALCARAGQVYAVERSPEACALIRQNRERFGVYNLFVVEGAAPDACQGLPLANAVFFGGTGGKLREILTMLLNRNPSVRVVLTAVTLETMHNGLTALEEYGFAQVNAVQLAVSRAERTAAGHLLRALNPVFVISGVGRG